jgi:hypothetical protein
MFLYVFTLSAKSCKMRERRQSQGNLFLMLIFNELLKSTGNFIILRQQQRNKWDGNVSKLIVGKVPCFLSFTSAQSIWNNSGN